MNLICFCLKHFSLNSLWKQIAIQWLKSFRKYLTKALDRKKCIFIDYLMSCKYMKTQDFFLMI